MEAQVDDVARFGSDPKALLKDNLAALERRIQAACQRAGRPREAVRLLPVSKTVPEYILRHAVELGLTDLGENKVQEAEQKAQTLADLNVRWNVIGHLQTNKVKQVVAFANEFHALDSQRVAEALQKSLAAAGKTLDVFVQVNTSGEPSKYGLSPPDVDAFVESLAKYPALKPRGLMTLAALTKDEVRIRDCFKLLRSIRDQIQRIHPDAGVNLLSMGMTSDFEIAIEEGADIVRVGQAIFGPRPTKDGTYWPGLVAKT